MLTLMKISDHMIGDRVSVRVRTNWLGGRVIGCDARPVGTRYVVQLDDDRRVVAEGPEVRRWSLSFELYDTRPQTQTQTLEKMAS